MERVSGWGEKSAVSLLNRYRAARHLSDDAFADIWSTETTTGQSVVNPHLSDCAQCRARYANFTGWLDRIQDDALAEADEAFPPERLAAQQAQVMRRLEGLERPARVIAFPRFSRPVTSTQGHAQRWVAAAAAAGLVIGLVAGQLFDVRHLISPTRGPVGTQTARFTAPQQMTSGNAVVIPASLPSVSDETLFFGGDPAHATARLSMLQSIDDITPRARDIDLPR